MFFMDIGKQVFKTPQSKLCCDKAMIQYAELKYIKLSFIPLFPFSTSYQSKCIECKSIVELTKNSDKAISWFDILSKFIGSGLLFFIALFLWQDKQKEVAQELAFLAQPQKYDFYLIDNSRFKNELSYRAEFVIAKVISVDKDKIEIVIGNYMYSRKRDLIKAIRLDTLVFDDFFPSKSQILTQAELINLYQDEVIYKALRPINFTLFGGVVLRPQAPEKLYKGYNPTPINQAGIRNYRNENFSEALALFKQAAEKGDAWAQINLAQMYRDGEGHQVDNKQALYWFEEAKQQGNKKAIFEYDRLCKQIKECSHLK
ncbi:tetratricopeptide repeat protein [Pseudoalteromonas denitrificans]|uniref:Sel1 repeat-containing protein n=1 Tax=Pseudoalteromonas denitrificans DSM 6059 TaxID=1123010 RepID=A0A1I1MCF5_9GAMM|nr:tetratricopeptide repeat protein [Pseudoalteromonas denitrificans]SFC83049.1 Sel1 repeat-containing protein [Pseudoalteromonas denitrificans DSM 6059]